MMRDQTDTLIVGAGLAGLSLADQLHRHGQSFLLVEARDRMGGRVKSAHVDEAAFDLGPAWFWEGQPRITALTNRFNLSVFEQFYEGELSFEDAHGAVQRGRGHASMQGSYRLQNGMTAITDALAASIPDQAVIKGKAVTQIAQTNAGITATLSVGTTVQARKVVLALPPRVAANHITFVPALGDDTIDAMQDVATWMAGQAKAVAVYDSPFWRNAGLSGDASSRHGPMVEIHDASPAVGGPYALFGFIGVPASARMDEALIKKHIIAQFERLFGPEAATPSALFVKDWAHDPHTATPLDHEPLYAHPQYGTPSALQNVWGGRITFGSTEMAPRFGGYLEGALEAAENVFDQLMQATVT